MSPVLLGRVSGSQAFASVASLRRVSGEVLEPIEPTYVDDVFSTFLYDGNGDNQSITNGIDLAGEGGLVWVKNRTSGSFSHVLASPDLVSLGKTDLASDSPDAASSHSNYVTSFAENGFSVGNSSSVNNGSHEYVSWTFRKAPGFFDVVTYTGSGASGNVSIPHNLGSVPGMILVKCTSHNSTNWHVYHRSLGATKYLSLNQEWGEIDSDGAWHDTEPTSTHFTLGNYPDVSWDSRTYVAYLFGHDEQSFGTNSDEAIIKCGSYTGSGNSETTVDLGFEPQWVMIKRLTGSDSEGWVIFDNMRGVLTGTLSGDMQLLADKSTQETDESMINFYSQGFKLQNDVPHTNHSGYEYAYMAIRRPHKPPTGGT